MLCNWRESQATEMPKLSTGGRKGLRDSAFAYVDPQGHRRFPIHDESHVRNARSRFNQVIFEDEAARNRARTRLLNIGIGMRRSTSRPNLPASGRCISTPNMTARHDPEAVTRAPMKKAMAPSP